MFIYSIYGTIKLKTNTDVFGYDIFKSLKKKSEYLDNQMKQSRFNFKFARKSNFRCEN